MGQKESTTSTSIVDPSSWSPRPMQLHHICGKNIEFSEGRTVAKRRMADKQNMDGLVHTAWPVAIGKMFQVTVVESLDKWAGSMGLGFTTISPAEYNEVPRSAISRPLDNSPFHWILWGTTLRHKKKRKRFHDLTMLKPGQTAGCLVTQTGEMHYFVDGRHIGRGWSGLPVDRPLWGIADVYGKCTKIKTEVLCDESVVDQQLSQTTDELLEAKHSLQMKEGLIHQLREQINHMDSEIAKLNSRINHTAPLPNSTCHHPLPPLHPPSHPVSLSRTPSQSSRRHNHSSSPPPLNSTCHHPLPPLHPPSHPVSLSRTPSQSSRRPKHPSPPPPHSYHRPSHPSPPPPHSYHRPSHPSPPPPHSYHRPSHPSPPPPPHSSRRPSHPSPPPPYPSHLSRTPPHCCTPPPHTSPEPPSRGSSFSTKEGEWYL